MGIPVSYVDEQVTIGFTIQSKYDLPSNASHVWEYAKESPDVSAHGIDVRSIDDNGEQISNSYDKQYNEKVQKSFVKAEIVGNGIIHDSLEDNEKINRLASMRWLVYKGLADIAEA